MRKTPPTNLPASIHQRLRNRAIQHNEDMNLVLTRYALERFLYRLSKSAHAGQFVLKGAMLFAIWNPRSHRPTRDLDMLAYGDDSEERLMRIFYEICQTQVSEDGLQFDVESLRVSAIREGQEYQGKHIEMTAYLGKSRIKVRIDIGFGDVITPQAKEASYPTLLDMPAPRLHVYPRETVVAEKLHAIVTLGAQNSRMKDFYDLVMLGNTLPFDGTILTQAVEATFGRRTTAIPNRLPVALTEEFGAMPDKRTQWSAFIKRGRLVAPVGDLSEVVQEVRAFLWPILQALAQHAAFNCQWDPGGPWR